jgi:DNA repair protein RecO (recombination protein O)
VPTIETDAVILRSIRFSEADVVLSVYSPDLGRVSAIAKGARKATSRLGGRLQPGVWAHLSIAQGRGDLGAIRGASTVHAHAGLWGEGYRIRAASSVLETVLRAVPEHEANEELFHLLTRTLAVLAVAAPGGGPPRLDPLVLAFQAKLLVVSGLLPRLGGCVVCGAAGPLVAFSAHAGGALCTGCARAGEPLDPIAREAFAGLVAHPVAEARSVCAPGACLGVERMIGLVLQEHLGVNLRSATPV